jgi:rSAM/selenodomain-associated transferase 1
METAVVRMTCEKIAIAVFVKTPGVSPLKTRLAAQIGTEQAETFHQLATRCIEQTLQTLQAQLSLQQIDLTPFWSVAEADAFDHPLWSAFPKIGQGAGDLGKRLHHVYSRLLDNHDAVFLMGADSPQIEIDYMQTAINTLSMSESSSFVMGPANDGGFVLFGGREPIPLRIWNAVPYSENETGKQLVRELQTMGQTTLLRERVDVDLLEDLELLLPDLEKNIAGSARQELKKWIQNLST